MNIRVFVVLLCLSGWVRSDQLCLVGDFDSQVRYLLDYEYLTPEQVQNMTRVYDDVIRTFEQRWTGIEILPLGSLVTGLASKMSDVDFAVKVQNANSSNQWELVDQAVMLFNKQPEVYGHIKINFVGLIGIPIITLYHFPTQRYCDISFSSRTSHENSKLLAYYFKLDPRNKPLASLLKFWSKVHRTISMGIVDGYTLNILIIFYLQHKEIVPATNLLQDELDTNVFTHWNTNFREIPFKSSNNETVYQLLGGFFEYYSLFNFADNILCPLVGRAFPRSTFKNVSSIPEDFALYKKYLQTADSERLDLDSRLCIQDVFKLNKNIASENSPRQVDAFISHVHFAAKKYKELPADRFLRAILTKDHHVYTRNLKGEVDEIRKYKDCVM